MKRTFIIGIFGIIFLLSTCQDIYSQRLGTTKTKGPMFITSLSFSQGIARIPYTVEDNQEKEGVDKLKNGISAIGISQFMGYQFNPYIALGIGLNFEYWTVKNGFVPLYVDLRINMMRTRFAPHLYLNLGYSNCWFITSKPYKASSGNSSDYIIHGSKSGIMGELGMGVKINFGYSTGLTINLFAKCQESALRYYENEGGVKPAQSVRPLLVNTDRASMYIFVGLKAGFVF